MPSQTGATLNLALEYYFARAQPKQGDPVLSRYLQVYDLRYCDRVLCKITVHHVFEYGGRIACHSSSPLGNSMSRTLYSLVQPSVH
jgi:hypothetical protein